MKKDIRIIALDLDGTALNSNKELTPAVRQAIEKAIAKGIVVMPATGRQYMGIPQEVLDIPGVDYALSSNGACIKNIKTGEKVHTDVFTAQQTLPLLGLAKKHGVFSSVYIDGEGFIEAERSQLDGFSGFLSAPIFKYILDTRIHVPDFKAFILEGNKEVEKFSFLFYDLQKREEFNRLLNERDDIITTSSLDYNLETNTKTATKGAALLAFGKTLGIKREQIMAVGDSNNDIAMLKAVGYAVAMGNANQEVKAIVDYVTKSCDEDGVAHAINQIL